MINEDKVRELFHVALYDSKDDEVQKQAASYYGWDYIWKEGLKSFFAGTFAFAGFLMLWIAVNAQELLEKYHAPHCAKLVLEAAEIYEKRGILL